MHKLSPPWEGLSENVLSEGTGVSHVIQGIERRGLNTQFPGSRRPWRRGLVNKHDRGHRSFTQVRPLAVEVKAYSCLSGLHCLTRQQYRVLLEL